LLDSVRRTARQVAAAFQPHPASFKITLAGVRLAPVKFARARQFIEAVAAHDFEAATELLDPDGETVTPRGTLRGIAACRQVLQKASGDEQFAMEKAEPEFEEVEGEVIARTRELARWRETGEVAYVRDLAVRLTLDYERIVRVVVMPGSPLPSQVQRQNRRRVPQRPRREVRQRKMEPFMEPLVAARGNQSQIGQRRKPPI